MVIKENPTITGELYIAHNPGGTLNVKKAEKADEDKYGKIVVYSGIYSYDVPDQYVADGLEAVQEGDVWVITPRTVVAKIGETSYYTLQEAIDAAQKR